MQDTNTGEGPSEGAGFHDTSVGERAAESAEEDEYWEIQDTNPSCGGGSGGGGSWQWGRWLCVCMYVWMDGCMHVCMYVWM